MKPVDFEHQVIRYLPKEGISPKYGAAYTNIGEAYVRSDLPKCAKLFVMAHEAYHLTDSSDSVLWREIKANLYPFWAIPAGFLWVAYTTLTSKERRAFYLSFWTKKGKG